MLILNIFIALNISILSLLWFCSASAFLIDDFTDADRREHLLTTKTNLHRFEKRHKLGYFFMPTDPEILIGTVRGQPGNLTYETSFPVKLEEMSTILLGTDIRPDQYNDSFKSEKELEMYRSEFRLNVYCNVTLYTTPNDKCKYEGPVLNLSVPPPFYSFDLLTAPQEIHGNFDPNKIHTISIDIGVPPTKSHYLFTLDQLEAIPEPFSMLTLGAGCLAFISKKYHKSKNTKP